MASQGDHLARSKNSYGCVNSQLRVCKCARIMFSTGRNSALPHWPAGRHKGRGKGSTSWVLTLILRLPACVTVCVFSRFSHVPLFTTLLDCCPSGSSVHGILQARILVWVAMSFFRGSSQPRDQTQVSHTAGGFFTIGATWEDHPCDGSIPNSE